ncbi:MAG: hypothetical protein AAF701_01815 [Pseudomonadota bacterium]
MVVHLCPMMQTNRSGNEIYATLYKACRGAGLPTAQGDQIAQIVAGAYSNLVLQAILIHLGQPQHPPLVTAAAQNVRIENVHILRDFPIIHDAFQAGLAQVTCTDLIPDALINALCHHFGWSLQVHPDALIFTPSDLADPQGPQRADVDNLLWDQLETWAYETYVPESDTSRLSGAGPGLSDND